MVGGFFSNLARCQLRGVDLRVFTGSTGRMWWTGGLVSA
jgi:hypothetical protein